jgi:hypothetical protein
VHLAAAPAWFADNATLIVLATLVVLASLVVWVIQRTSLRVACVGVAAVLALLVYVNREPLRACARTCECHVAGQDLTVPACDPENGR